MSHLVETLARTPVTSPKPVTGKGHSWERTYAIVSIAPALLLMAVFTIYPFAYAISISAFKYVLTKPKDHPFVGLANFTETIGSYYFLNSLTNTVLYTLAVLVVVVLFGFALAQLLNTKIRTAGFLKIIILLPWAIPAVVSGLIWRWELNSDFGILNGLLFQFGLIDHYIPFLSDPNLAKLSLVMAYVWKEAPLVAIFFLAGLQLIPPELYENARIDGGSAWNSLRYITIPLIRPILLIVLVYETMMAILTFDVIYVLTGGGPGDATALISWFAYAEIYKSLNLGHGIALSIIIGVLTLGLILVYLRALRSEEIYA